MRKPSESTLPFGSTLGKKTLRVLGQKRFTLLSYQGFALRFEVKDTQERFYLASLNHLRKGECFVG